MKARRLLNKKMRFEELEGRLTLSVVPGLPGAVAGPSHCPAHQRRGTGGKVKRNNCSHRQRQRELVGLRNSVVSQFGKLCRRHVDRAHGKHENQWVFVVLGGN